MVYKPMKPPVISLLGVQRRHFCFQFFWMVVCCLLLYLFLVFFFFFFFYCFCDVEDSLVKTCVGDGCSLAASTGDAFAGDWFCKAFSDMMIWWDLARGYKTFFMFPAHKC